MNDSKEIGEDWELAICLTSCVWLLDNDDGEGGINPLVAKILYDFTGPLQIDKNTPLVDVIEFSNRFYN